MNKSQKTVTWIAILALGLLWFFYSDDAAPKLSFYGGMLLFGALTYGGLMLVLKKQ